MKFAILAAIAALVVAAAPAQAAESGWVKQKALLKITLKMKKKNLFPIAVNCRNSPKAKVTPRPEINVKYGKVAGVTDSLVVMHGGTNTVFPYNPLTGKKNGWQRKGGKSTFRAGASKRVYSCYRWLKKG